MLLNHFYTNVFEYFIDWAKKKKFFFDPKKIFFFVYTSVTAAITVSLKIDWMKQPLLSLSLSLLIQQQSCIIFHTFVYRTNICIISLSAMLNNYFLIQYNIG